MPWAGTLTELTDSVSPSRSLSFVSTVIVAAVSSAVVAESLTATGPSLTPVTVTVCAMFQSAGVNVTLNIVGFAIDDAKLRAAFEQWSERGGGTYFDGRDAAGLDAGVQAAFRPAFEVVDASGQTVVRGIVGGDAIELMPGSYTVRSGTRTKSVDLGDGATVDVAL